MLRVVVWYSDICTYLVHTRYVSTSFMCEMVDRLYATVETHWGLFHYVLK